MKIFYFTLLGVCLSLFSCSQKEDKSIKDIFLLLPNESVDDLPISDRKKLLESSFLNKYDMLYYSMDQSDVESGLLHLKMGWFEKEKASGFAEFDICAWKCPDGSQLVAVPIRYGSSSDYFHGKLFFYKYQDGQITKVDYKVFAEYSEERAEMLNAVIDQMVNENITAKDKDELRSHILFEIAKDGTGIKVYYDAKCDPESDARITKLRTTEMFYEWMGDGTFKKS